MRWILTCYIFIVTIGNAFSQNVDINQYSSDNMELIYLEPGIKYIIPYSGQCFENAYTFHKNFWDYKPDAPVTILFNDFSDYGNGGAMVTPWSFVSISVAPFEHSFDVIPSNERMQWLMNHELTHIVIADKPSSDDIFWRDFFYGKIYPDNTQPVSMLYAYLTTPRWYSPRWYHEGIAVFMETWLSGGKGRTVGGYDEMVFRTMVRDSSYFYKPVGLETEGTTIDFQVGVNAYLYGTRFVVYLAAKHGLDKLQAFFNRTESSKRFYASQFENVYGVDIETEWDNWIKYEHDFQNKNLKNIRAFPVSKPKRIVSQGLGSVSKAYYDKDTRSLYAAVNYPGDFAHVTSINIDNGEMKNICNIPSPSLYSVASMAYDHDSKKLFLSTQNQQIRGLEQVDLISGKKTELITYTRTGDFAFNQADNSLWGIRHWSGRAALVQLPPPYTKSIQIYPVPFGKSLFSPSISNNGKLLLATMSEASGRQSLIMFNLDSLQQGIQTYEKIYEFENSTASEFRFSPDDKVVYGSSYYTGVSNIFRIDLSTKAASIITNSETGFFRPLPISNDTLLAFEYSTDGLIPCLIKTDTLSDVNAIRYLGMDALSVNPELNKMNLPSASLINMDSVVKIEGNYNTLSNMELANFYPIVEGYKDFPAYGIRFNLMDRSMINNVSINLSYSPNMLLPQDERLHLFLDWRWWFLNIKFGLNNGDFYDLFGPTKSGRKGYFVAANYEDFFYYARSPHTFKYSLNASYRWNIDRLPDYQNVLAQQDRMASFGGYIFYSYFIKSLGGVESEQGWSWKITSRNYYVSEEVIPHLIGNLDGGILLPIRNSSFWLRASAGLDFSASENSFNKFYFGGFGNNYVDCQNIHRYREYYSLPGLELNEVGGKNFAKLLAELNLPPIRFKNFGFLYFYPTYMRLSLFAAALELNVSKSGNPAIFSYGAQADFELAFFTLLKTTFSAGYGVAAKQGRKPSGELMLSLKLM